MNSSLAEYYQSLGFPTSKWHVGAEHPYLEQYAIRLLQTLSGGRVLEIGYQAGGFAVPVILAMQGRPDFSYLGVDSLSYGNAVRGEVIAAYLKSHGITSGVQFVETDAHEFLSQDHHVRFDLVLIDHYKPLYPRDLLAVVRAGLVNPGGVILLHDILGRARGVAKLCEAIAKAYGYTWTVTEEVPEGVAVLRDLVSNDKKHHGLPGRFRRGIVRALVGIQRLTCLTQGFLQGVAHRLAKTVAQYSG